MPDLEAQFDAAMFDIYRRAHAEVGYNATRYLKMLNDHGGLGTAEILLHADGVSDGFTKLWEAGRLDLTVEALVLERPEYHALFDDDAIEEARNRLRRYEYTPKHNHQA